MEKCVSRASIAKTPASGRADVAQAVTGIILAIFTLMHAVFVGTVIISPHLLNSLAWLLEATYIEHVVPPTILFIMVAHFLFAAKKMPFRFGELKTFFAHAKSMKHCDTSLWLVQAITAIIVLVLVSAHIHTIATSLPINAAASAAREQNGWTPFYVVMLISVGLHLGIGLFRVGVKYGFICDKNRSTWAKRFWMLIGAYVFIGLVTIIRFHYIAV